MLRALVLSMLVALSLAADSFPPLANNGSMDLLSYKLTRGSVRCGKVLSVVAKVRLNSFGDADTLYCAMRNLNDGVAEFDLKERVTRFKNVNTRKYALTFGEEEVPGDVPAKNEKKYWWSWNKDGALYSEGLTYTLRISTILEKATANSATWRFYCETKKLNTTSHYYWDKTGANVNLPVSIIGAPCEAPVKGGKGGK